MSKASKPEPPPKDLGVDVGESLDRYLCASFDFEETELQQALDLIRERIAFGLAKYGQPLRTKDGRDGVEDLRQELGDAIMYAHKIYLTGQINAEQHKEVMHHLVCALAIIEGDET